MGGNALRNCTTRRYQADEYYILEVEILAKMWKLFPDCRVSAIKAYHSKQSFGDMDLLIDSENLPTNWLDIVIRHFHPKEYVKNGNVLSFEYKEFQIDLIVTKPSEYITSVYYFSYNDLGNFIGNLAKRIGLTLGHDGVRYEFKKSPTEHFKTVLLPISYHDLLELLGLDPNRYDEGFDELEDIFDFIMGSPYFHKDIFLLDNRNHANRVRDAKRKSYMSFLEYMKDYEETPVQQYNYSLSKGVFLNMLFNSIKGFEQIYIETWEEYDELQEYKRRFNGDLVRQWTGLDGKELGEFMKYLKPIGEQHRQWILNSDLDDIRDRYVMLHFEHFKENQ